MLFLVCTAHKTACFFFFVTFLVKQTVRTLMGTRHTIGHFSVLFSINSSKRQRNIVGARKNLVLTDTFAYTTLQLNCRIPYKRQMTEWIWMWCEAAFQMCVCTTFQQLLDLPELKNHYLLDGKQPLLVF